MLRSRHETGILRPMLGGLSISVLGATIAADQGARSGVLGAGMSPLDAAHQLVARQPDHCPGCGAILWANGDHAPDCPWLAMPKIVAALETLQEIANDCETPDAVLAQRALKGEA